VVLECSVDLRTDRFNQKIRYLVFPEIVTQKIVKLCILIIFYAMVMVAVKVMVRLKSVCQAPLHNLLYLRIVHI